MAYQSWSVVFGEQPSAAKWNILGTNDASFNDGTGIGAGVITSESLNATIAFHAYRNAAKVINGAYADVVHDTERYDLGSDFNTATGAFTAPVAGVYLFTTNVNADATTNVRTGLQFICSTAGTKRATDIQGAAGQDARFLQAVLEIDLALNETVKVQCFTTGSTDIASTDTWFAGHFVGV